ncbi:MAG: hypothetical protein AB7P99_02090 [Vicinamibacterales bacterium]
MKTAGLALVVLVLAAAQAGAQSLADVARQEEARRKTVTRPGRVFTNDDLRSVPPPAPAAPATPAATPAPAQTEAPAAAGQESAAAPGSSETPAPAQDEEAWRGRLTAARDSLARSQAFAEALQSQINGLNTDFAARDDPAQRAQISTRRQTALAELDRVKEEIAQFEKQITDIQEEGRRAGVPAGWLR